MRLLRRQGFPIEVRELGDAGFVRFHSSVFGNEDTYETIFDKGCFKKTISEHGGKFPVLWFHDMREPIALMDHKEDATGLLVEGNIDLDIPTGQRVYSGLKKGYIDCASIGFDVITETIKQEKLHFQEIRLWESSLLTRNFASNEEAKVEEVRTMKERIADLLADGKALEGEELTQAIADLRALLTELETRAIPPQHITEPPPLTVPAHLLSNLQDAGRTLAARADTITRGKEPHGAPDIHALETEAAALKQTLSRG